MRDADQEVPRQRHSQTHRRCRRAAAARGHRPPPARDRPPGPPASPLPRRSRRAAPSRWTPWSWGALQREPWQDPVWSRRSRPVPRPPLFSPGCSAARSAGGCRRSTVAIGWNAGPGRV
ncbi:hypothetical protein E0H73_01850 [Kribbella pittospori]|uniref:Uncharacterized protein n=1 Tax=Kribbella pittospori TaxID=722689 RepID=A0A4R0KX72_9ACTN|nr:hypothetical protein E0H73_01850 [Kribbella pittospori]